MTIPPTEEPNRPVDSGFDFLLSQQSTPLPQPQSFGQGGMDDRPRAEQRRRAQVDTRSLAVPLIVSLVVVAALVAAGATWFTLVESSEAQVREDSAAMCAELATTPGVLDQQGFGWPTSGANLTETLESMKAYRDRWQALAASAAPTIRPDANAVAKAASTIIESIEVSKTIDRPGSLAQMQSVTAATAIPAWVAKYCD